jgi:hypothetical protein
MGLTRDFVELLAKEKWVAYLFLLWGGARFFWGLDGVLTPFDWSYSIANIFYLIGGLVLALFALKLLKSNFLGVLPKENLFAYFLLLWGGSSFFFAVHDIIWRSEVSVGLIAALLYLLSAALLVLLGYKLLQSKDT